jgi:hypothetical protein
MDADASRRDGETRGQGDKETRGQGGKNKRSTFNIQVKTKKEERKNGTKNREQPSQKKIT